MKLNDVLDDPKPLRTPAEKNAIMLEADREIEAFDKFFSAPISEGGAGNSPMVRSEKAILKTYLVARLAKLFPSHLEDMETSPV